MRIQATRHKTLYGTGHGPPDSGTELLAECEGGPPFTSCSFSPHHSDIQSPRFPPVSIVT